MNAPCFCDVSDSQMQASFPYTNKEAEMNLAFKLWTKKRKKKIRVKFAFHGQGEGYSADMKVTGLQSCLGACGCSLSPSCVC